jgi:hypothetical protein
VVIKGFTHFRTRLALVSPNKGGEAFNGCNALIASQPQTSLPRHCNDVFSHTTSNFNKSTKISRPAAMQTDAQRGRAGARKIMIAPLLQR